MSVEQQINPNVMLIATRKYNRFVEPLVKQLDRHFLPNHEIAITVFSDEKIREIRTSARVQMVYTAIPSYGWPYATIYRYKTFLNISEYLKKFSHLYYMDVDMAIVDEIGDEFLVDGLLNVRHPGTYSTDRWGSPNNPTTSTSWFPEEARKHYCCGGVQGGKTEHYLEMCKTLAENISKDEKNNVMAEWHDETHANKYWSYDKPKLVTTLSPAYCMPESEKHQKEWGLSEFKPKIIALDKNHNEIRS